MERTEDTRERIKQTAREFFAERGIGQVSIREILAAAGQRNVGAIGYYFRSKDALVREILVDGALWIDERRIAMLDALEQEKPSFGLRDVIGVIVRSSIDLEGDRATKTYIRFFTMLRLHDPAQFADVVLGRQDVGFRRCIVHLRRLCAEYPSSILSERIRFMMLMMGASLSVRELAAEAGGNSAWSQLLGGRSWASPTLIENLIDACEAVVTRPVSDETAAILAARDQ